MTTPTECPCQRAAMEMREAAWRAHLDACPAPDGTGLPCDGCLEDATRIRILPLPSCRCGAITTAAREWYRSMASSSRNTTFVQATQDLIRAVEEEER